MKNIPFIFYAHGLDITLPQKFMRKKKILKKIIKEAKAIVANSHFTKDELVKLGADSDKIKVIYPCPGVKPSEAPEWKIREIREEYGLKNKKIILTVGRLVERKGHDMVIKSLPKIIKKIPDAAYLIVGTGPYEDNLKKLANQLALREYIIFAGKASQNDLSVLFQIADVFIMPARRLINGDVEGFGIVYLEANLFGKPVIGGKSGGVPEAIIDGKTGLLVDPLNVDQIAEAALKILTDKPYAQKLGMQGMERVLENFNWETQAQKIKEILS